MEEELAPHELGAVPVLEEGVLDDIQKYSRETSTSGEGVEAAAAKQSIIEVPNGQSIDGQPQQPGPQYKRGRGRSFFKDAPRKGVSCQGRFNFTAFSGNQGKVTSASNIVTILYPNLLVLQCLDAIDHCTNLEIITRYESLVLFSAFSNLISVLKFANYSELVKCVMFAEIQGSLVQLIVDVSIASDAETIGGCIKLIAASR